MTNYVTKIVIWEVTNVLRGILRHKIKMLLTKHPKETKKVNYSNPNRY